MKRLFFLAWAGLKSRRRSSALLISTIALAVLFLVVMGEVGYSALYTIDSQNRDLYGEQKAVAWNLTDEELQQMEKQTVWTRIGHIAVYGTAVPPDGDSFGVGTISEEAMALGHLRLAAGRLPLAADEIVLESGTYTRLCQQDYTEGGPVTLDITTAAGNTVRRTYRVVGLLENYSAVWSSEYSYAGTENADVVPLVSAILSEQGADALSETAAVTLLLDCRDEDFDTLWTRLRGYRAINYTVYAHLSHFGMGEAARGALGISALLGGIVLICMMSILLNGFLMSVDKRREQIALLRSIGATKKQARGYIYAEALLLSVIGIPVGLLLGVPASFGALQLFSALGQSTLYYRFNGWLLLLAVGISGVCIWLSVLLPALHASRSAPIAGVRPVPFRRKQKARRVSMRPVSLVFLSLRKSKGKTALTALSFSLVIITFNFTMLYYLNAYQSDYRTPNVTLTPPKLTEPVFALDLDTLEAPDFTGLFDDVRQRIPGAEQSAGIDPLFRWLVPEDRCDEYLNGYYRLDYERLGISSGSKFSNYETEMQLQYGYDEEEYLLYPSVSVLDDALLAQLQPYVTQGRIDIEAIRRGEEIVLCMPDYALTIEYDENRMHTSVEPMRNNPVITPNTTVLRNAAWKAGDTLTFTWVELHEGEPYQKQSRTVRIGAIVRELPPIYSNSGGPCGMVMGEGALETLGLPYGLDGQAVYFPPETNIGEGEALIKQLAVSRYPSCQVSTKTEINQAEQRVYRLSVTVMFALTISLLALGMLGLLNTVTNRLYNRTHEIGLLRCIGMTKGQILRQFAGEGAVFGLLASVVGTGACMLVFPHFVRGWYQTLAPAMLLASCLVCMALAVLTAFLPARTILRGTPAETVRLNL